jgi:hypothetical protein
MLIDELKSREVKDTREYEQLVADLAAGGTEPGVHAAEKILGDAGKSAADLEADVTRLRRVRELEAIVVEAPAVEQDRQALEADIRSKFDALQKEQETLRQRGLAIEAERAHGLSLIGRRQRRIDESRVELARLTHKEKPQAEPREPAFVPGFSGEGIPIESDYGRLG